MKFYEPITNNEIDEFATNLQEVKKLIHNININKSSAMDNLPSRILKQAFQHTPEMLVKMFNLSFSSGCDSLLTQIPKSGNLRSVNNYRPISLLPLPGKLLEKIVHNRIYGFLSREKILTDKQGGFRPGHSTVDTLTMFTDDILHGLNVAKSTVATFIDLRKAFDTVDHFILVDKMKYYGIKNRNILWIETTCQTENKLL